MLLFGAVAMGLPAVYVKYFGNDFSFKGIFTKKYLEFATRCSL